MLFSFQVYKQLFDGTPWGIRTLDLLVRSQTLYPAELRAHVGINQ